MLWSYISVRMKRDGRRNEAVIRTDVRRFRRPGIGSSTLEELIPSAEETVRKVRNPTHGSGWIVQTQPTHGRTGFHETKSGPVCLVGRA